MYSKDLQFLHDIDLVEFVGFMSLGGLAASTITIYISGVRHKLKLMSKDDFQHSFLLKLVLHGMNNSTQQPDVHYEICMFSGLLAVGFHSLFRPGELTYSQHSITVDNMHVSASNKVVVLLTSKAKCTHIAQ